MPTICVYCASRHGLRPEHGSAARELGAAVGARGWSLVYGGGHVGLMGVVADAALDAGAHVTGVITEHLHDLEVGHDAVSELIVVSDMTQRKQEMFGRSDAFVVLPGGIGTLEELFEVWSWSALGLHDKPLILVNLDGYYDHLIAFLVHSVGVGLFDGTGLAAATVAPTIADAMVSIESVLV